MSQSNRYFSELHDDACENARVAGRNGNVALAERWLRIADHCMSVEERVLRVRAKENELFGVAERPPLRSLR